MRPINDQSIFRRSGNRFAAENAIKQGKRARIPIPSDRNSLQTAISGFIETDFAIKRASVAARPVRSSEWRTRVPRIPKPAKRAPRATSAIDYGPLDDWVGFRLRMAQAASFQAFARLTHDVKIRPGRFATLMLIGRNPGISQTVLSQANGRDKSTLTPVLNDLVKRGLVRRERTRDDRRAYQLALTAAGRRLLDKLAVCAVRHDRNLDRIIGRRDRARFLATLRRIETALANEGGNGRASARG
jgi:DNA-binding MarR family transcriptional regulator